MIIVLLNLFRDQLDRYGEVDVIAEKWEKLFLKLDTGNQSIKPYQLIANADDPLIACLALKSGLEVRYFGLNDRKLFQKQMDHATDSIFCPHCGARLVYDGVYYSHIGMWHCDVCGLKRPETHVDTWPSPLPGLYNQYNTMAAAATLACVGIGKAAIQTSLVDFVPAFGRQEEFIVNNKKIKLFLSKNPAGFNASLQTVLAMKPTVVLLVLNDRIPDGRDVSWIWDVDFENLNYRKTSIVVSGDRTYDLALRLKYEDIRLNDNQMFINLGQAITTSLSMVKSEETLYILATYSAMLEVRKIVGGRKIL